MISTSAFDPSGFEVACASEQGILARIARADRKRKPVLLQGEQTGSTNAGVEVPDLAGCDGFFGSNRGGATVYPNTSAG